MLRIVRNDSSAFFIVLSCWDVVFYGRLPLMVAYMDIGGRATQDAVAEEVLAMHYVHGWTVLEQRRSSCRGAIGSAKGWRALLNQMSEEEQKEFEEIHRKEIADVLGFNGVWFNTEVLIAVGEMPTWK